MCSQIDDEYWPYTGDDDFVTIEPDAPNKIKALMEAREGTGGPGRSVQKHDNHHAVQEPISIYDEVLAALKLRFPDAAEEELRRELDAVL